MEHNTATDTAALLAEIDTAMAAYTASIDRGLALAAEMRQMADTIDGGMAAAGRVFQQISATIVEAFHTAQLDPERAAKIQEIAAQLKAIRDQ